MKNKFGIVLLLLVSLILSGCAPIHTKQQEYPAIVKAIRELPEEFDTLIIMDNYKFITRQNKNLYKYEVGGISIRPYYYEQVWFDNREDAIWVLRDETETILRGDIIRITTLKRE